MSDKALLSWTHQQRRLAPVDLPIVRWRLDLELVVDLLRTGIRLGAVEGKGRIEVWREGRGRDGGWVDWWRRGRGVVKFGDYFCAVLDVGRMGEEDVWEMDMEVKGKKWERSLEAWLLDGSRHL
jgi:hypothetical protein